MTLLEMLKEDLVNAMKAKDKVVLTTLRGVKGAMQMEVINNKKEETDELVLEVVNKQIKMRLDSITEFKKANRLDLINSYQSEIDILQKYMPKQLSIEELNVIIDEVFDLVKPGSARDLGKVMKEIMPLVKNKCDMTQLNNLIKEKLN